MSNYSYLLQGNKLFQQRARLVLPYLVRQAKANETIYYSDLANMVNMPNARNLNYILGEIGTALESLSKVIKREIPRIQSLVVNKQNGLPGDGLSFFIKDFDKLNRSQKEKKVDGLLEDVFNYPDWDWVLEQLGLEPIEIDLQSVIAKAKTWKGSSEGKLHKEFKEYLSQHPEALGLSSKINTGKTEHKFPSADAIDILFIDKDIKIGVEVKSIISNEDDILRGLFQCVKYKHLIEAEQIINNEIPNSRVILALQGKFPNNKGLVLIKNLLGIEVIDQIKIY